jgi:hypothetical protein
MPKWIPIVIGIVLVVLAALAIYTGLRYRSEETLASHLRPHREPPRRTAPAPPGEPEAGASFVLPGAAGENVPAANTPVAGDSRAVITGGPGGVQSTVRIWARRGMVLDVTPDDALVYVNELPVGTVRQFNSADEAYEFAAPGSYTIKIIAHGYRERQFVVTSAEDAEKDIATISAKLDKD